MKQVVRIIGGRFRGKKLHFPDLPNLRPTSDRIRETVFNWLMNDIQDKICLDAFAGSGALGFEAYSRGADSVTMIEKASKAIIKLKENAESLTILNKPLNVYQMDSIHFLKSTHSVFDIIFLDPPFKDNQMSECIEIISQRKLLSPDGILYLESPKEMMLPDHKWKVIKQKKSGQVTYALYKKAD